MAAAMTITVNTNRASDSVGLSTTLRDAANALAAVSETARLDAELLMAFALGLDRSAMLLAQRDLTVPFGFAALLSRRLQHEPVAYITGTQAFWDLELSVTPDVLIPRADSETLIEAAIAGFAGAEPPTRVLDLGTGSGALLLAALSAFPQAQGVGVDASSAAIAVAQGNAQRLGFSTRAAFAHMSWRDAGWVAALDVSFDLILCNPPYVETSAVLAPMVADYEPHSALFAGAQGLDDYAILIPAIPALLAPAGIAVFEIGATQGDAVAALARDNGFETRLHLDLAGNQRALTLRTKQE
jgi:release factor glutamine methyltransferase